MNEKIKLFFKRKWVIILLVCICISVILASVISAFFYQHTRVHGLSMQFTLKDDDVVIINKYIYKFHAPNRFDIILFKTKNDDYYIKRIIGIPGDTIQIIDGYIYIDGEMLAENYGLDPILEAGIAKNAITLQDAEYFVLGDNRNYSTDSRDESVGIVHEEDIIGKAVYQIFPFDRFGEINNDANLNLNNYDKEE